jgi:DNA-directed RNA polymerase subunit K/omega
MESLNLYLEDLSRETGGRYLLVTLMQKRLRELQHGQPPLVENIKGLLPHEVVAEEVRQGKVWLITGEEALEIRRERHLEAQAEESE